MLKPFMRDYGDASPNVEVVQLFYARENRLEGLPSLDVFIYVVFVICAVERQVEEVPLSGVEAIALVNECDAVAALMLREYCLPSIGIAGPFIEGKNANEVLPIYDSIEDRLRQVLENKIIPRIGNVTYSDMQP